MKRMLIYQLQIIIVVLMLSACSQASRDDVFSAPPHIILMIADDLGIGYAPCLSDPSHMPNLSALCDNALVFEQAYTHPVCTPSRASIMTGRHTFRTGASDVLQQVQKLTLDEITIPELVRSQSDLGYQFAAFGKWHLASDEMGGDRNPNLQGFDYFEGTPRQHHTYRYTDYDWFVNGNLVASNVQTYKTTQIVNSVSSHFQRSHTESPWFYWIGFVNPHLPFHLPPNELHSFDHLEPRSFTPVFRQPQSDDEVRVNRPTQRVVPYYQAMVEALDTEIGRLIESLEQSSDRPIIFILLGDNGDQGEVATNALTGLRGAKAKVYETGVRVPLMIWSNAPNWSQSHAGLTDRLTHLADIYPTIAELTGAFGESGNLVSHTIDSLTFASLINSDLPSSQPQEFIYLQRGNKRQQPFAFAARNVDGYKLILREFERRVEYSEDIIEFYDLSTDPGERTNLFPSLCDHEQAIFWDLFAYIADLNESEPQPYGAFNRVLYHEYIQNMLDLACENES